MLDEGSAETVKAELSIFEPLPYQVSHIKGNWIRHEPENDSLGTNTNTPITFKIPKAAGLYIDFNDSFIDLEVAIESSATFATDTSVAFVNFALHSLFKDVTFEINGTKIEGANQHYAYKAYIFALINASQEAKRHQLQSSGWMHDTNGQFDIATNAGFVARQQWTAAGVNMYFAGPLFLDTWIHEQYFTDACDIRLKFH